MRGPITGKMAIDAAEGLAAHLMAPLTDLVELDVDEDSVVDKIELDEEQARVKAREAIRWNVFNRPYMIRKDAFGQGGDLRLEYGEVRLIYYPFWVAYFETGAKMDLVVIEALEGHFEGPGIADTIARYLAERLLPSGRSEREANRRGPR